MKNLDAKAQRCKELREKSQKTLFLGQGNEDVQGLIGVLGQAEDLAGGVDTAVFRIRQPTIPHCA
jgi:hypothetical protein